MTSKQSKMSMSGVLSEITPWRDKLLAHPLYERMERIEDVRVFMEGHVYAVWDFMSILKCLQRSLTCVSHPWFPVGDAETRYLINEIVVGEESDLDEFGIRKSHFEMYLQAMKQIGANVKTIETFVTLLKNGASLELAFEKSKVPEYARQFVRTTMEIIENEEIYTVAAVFSFGREDLIPGMFMALVEDLDDKFPSEMSGFTYYLQRHIEVDGDHHSHLAWQMTSNLCGDDSAKWATAIKAVKKALVSRKALWDGVLEEIETTRGGLELPVLKENG